MPQDDFLLDVMRLVVTTSARCGQITDHIARDIEREVRREWGGERPLIAKVSPRDRAETRQRIAAIVAEVADGRSSPDEAAAEGGISRRTLYRYLGKRPV